MTDLRSCRHGSTNVSQRQSDANAKVSKPPTGNGVEARTEDNGRGHATDHLLVPSGARGSPIEVGGEHLVLHQLGDQAPFEM